MSRDNEDIADDSATEKDPLAAGLSRALRGSRQDSSRYGKNRLRRHHVAVGMFPSPDRESPAGRRRRGQERKNNTPE